MKRLASIGAIAVFIVGVLVIPGLHQADGCSGDSCESTHAEPSCADCQHDDERTPPSRSQEDGHDSENCALCKLAGAPAMPASVGIEVVQIGREAEDLGAAHIVVVPHNVVRLSLARAPPFSPPIGLT